jgi:hypothetical protein
MGADCRVTFRQSGREEVFTDNCIKLFEIGESSVIGFVGFLPLASADSKGAFQASSES